MLSKITRAENCFFVYPDTLVKILKESKLNYLIDAKLKTGASYDDVQLSVNTIKHFIFAISYKYPELFTLIRTVGEEQDCSKLYEIDWKKIDN